MKEPLPLFILFFYLSNPVLSISQKPSSAQMLEWEKDPEIVRNFKLGRELRRAGKLADAVEAYKKVLSKAPGMAVAHLNLGLVYHDQKAYEASSKEFFQALTLDSSLHMARLYLGIDAYLSGQYDMAETALQEACKAKSSEHEALYWLGLTRAAKGHLTGAAQSLEEAAKLNPKDEDTLYQLQEVYLRLWQYTYDRLAAANPDSFRIHQVIAEGYLQSDRLEEARKELEQVLRMNPNVTGVHEALGDIDRRQEKSTSALEHYRRETQLDPRNPSPWYKISETAFDEKDYATAAEAVKTCLSMDKNYAPAYYTLGRLARQEGRKPEAIAQLQKSIKLGLKPSLAESAHYLLFRLLTETGEKAQAQVHKQEFARLQEARKKLALSVAERERKDQGEN